MTNSSKYCINRVATKNRIEWGYSMKENRLATIIKKDMLKKKANKLDIDTLDTKTKEQIYRIIKTHKSVLDRLA